MVKPNSLVLHDVRSSVCTQIDIKHAQVFVANKNGRRNCHTQNRYWADRKKYFEIRQQNEKKKNHTYESTTTVLFSSIACYLLMCYLWHTLGFWSTTNGDRDRETERASGIVFDSMWFMYIKDCGQEVINRLHKAAHKKRTEKNGDLRTVNTHHWKWIVWREGKSNTNFEEILYLHILTAGSNLLLLYSIAVLFSL